MTCTMRSGSSLTQKEVNISNTTNFQENRNLNNLYCLKDILTSLGLEYRDASLKILYFVVQGISIPKIRYRIITSHKKIHVKK